MSYQQEIVAATFWRSPYYIKFYKQLHIQLVANLESYNYLHAELTKLRCF